MKKLLLALLLISTAAFSQKILVRDGTKLVPIILTAQEGDTLVMSSMMPEFFSRFGHTVDDSARYAIASLHTANDSTRYVLASLRSMSYVDSTWFRSYINSLIAQSASDQTNYMNEYVADQNAAQDVNIGNAIGAAVSDGVDEAENRVMSNIAGWGYQTLGLKSMANVDSTRYLKNSSSYIGSNIGIGDSSLISTTTGNSNIAIGMSSLRAITSSSNNVMIGHYAARARTGSFSNNVGIGANVLSVTTTAMMSSVTAVGNSAMMYRSGGANNTAVGAQSQFGYSTRYATGANNTSVGFNSLASIIGAGHNTAIGANALSADSSGGYNVVVGSSAATNNSSGSYNTLLGASSATNSRDASNRIAIGYASGGWITNSNTLSIDAIGRANVASDTTDAIIYGVMDAVSSNQKLYFNSNVSIKHALTINGSTATRNADIYTIGQPLALDSSMVVAGRVFPLMVGNNEVIDTLIIVAAGTASFTMNLYCSQSNFTATDSLMSAVTTVSATNTRQNVVTSSMRNSGSLGTRIWWFKMNTVATKPDALVIQMKGHRI